MTKGNGICCFVSALYQSRMPFLEGQALPENELLVSNWLNAMVVLCETESSFIASVSVNGNILRIFLFNRTAAGSLPGKRIVKSSKSGYHACCRYLADVLIFF